MTIESVLISVVIFIGSFHSNVKSSAYDCKKTVRDGAAATGLTWLNLRCAFLGYYCCDLQWFSVNWF